MLLHTIKPDKHSKQLLEQMRAEEALGRMTNVSRVSEVDLSSVLLAHRFGVEQGSKVRAVDDESANGANRACEASENLANDLIDAFVAVICRMFAVVGIVPMLFKACSRQRWHSPRQTCGRWTRTAQ